MYGSGGSSVLVKECVLPQDQTGTISGRWKALAIPIAFHSGSQFDPDEVAAITKAADTWNEFYGASLGLKVLDYGSASSPRTSSAASPTSSTLCTSGIVQGSSFTGSVVIYKKGKWPYSSLPKAIALTGFCPVPAKPISNIYMAMMELNYQNFFIEGKQQPDLQSIMLHEFGHLLGLNHSCESGSTRAGVPNCTNTNITPDYLIASMFPQFGFDSAGTGEQRRNLQANDQGRGNCLYQNMAKAQ